MILSFLSDNRLIIEIAMIKYINIFRVRHGLPGHAKNGGNTYSSLSALDYTRALVKLILPVCIVIFTKIKISHNELQKQLPFNKCTINVSDIC